MYEIKVEAGAVLSKLQQLADEHTRNTPMMRKVSIELVSQTEANFDAEGRPHWMGLAPSTIKARKRVGTWPGKMMQASGQLAASYHPFHDALSAGVGSNKPYAAIQNLGGTIHKPAQSRQVRHRTHADGSLVRNEWGGLVFAKDSHKRTRTRWFEQGKHSIDIPARPQVPIDAQGNLQPEAESAIMGVVNDYLRGVIGE